MYAHVGICKAGHKHRPKVTTYLFIHGFDQLGLGKKLGRSALATSGALGVAVVRQASRVLAIDLASESMRTQ